MIFTAANGFKESALNESLLLELTPVQILWQHIKSTHYGNTHIWRKSQEQAKADLRMSLSW